MSVRAMCMVGVLLGALASAHAQPGRFPQPKTEPFAADGVIQAIAQGRIQILTNSNQNWLIFLDAKTVIHVTGTAEPDFLRPGLFVRFSIALDKRGNAHGKVGELTIFTPSPQQFPGIWPEGGNPENPGGAGEGFGGGFGGANAGGGFGTPDVAVYTVAGQIQPSRKGKMTVNYGRGSVQVELAEKVSIKVDFADYSVAKKGDRISIKKGRMYPGRPTIELSDPLTFGTKKPVRPTPLPKPRRPTRPPKEDASPEPFGGAAHLGERVQTPCRETNVCPATEVPAAAEVARSGLPAGEKSGLESLCVCICAPCAHVRRTDLWSVVTDQRSVLRFGCGFAALERSTRRS